MVTLGGCRAQWPCLSALHLHPVSQAAALRPLACLPWEPRCSPVGRGGPWWAVGDNALFFSVWKCGGMGHRPHERTRACDALLALECQHLGDTHTGEPSSRLWLPGRNIVRDVALSCPHLD